MAKQVSGIRPSDLPDLLSAPQPHPFLYCEICGERNSAHAGDYWDRKDEPFMHCGETMRLVKQEVRIVDVKPQPRKKVRA